MSLSPIVTPFIIQAIEVVLTNYNNLTRAFHVAVTPVLHSGF
ncbi:MAG: hypothetical protein VX273_03140 [Acidobacteriota bacterium]|nr:hypothetical protein [Acidobacteriota bacterium]